MTVTTRGRRDRWISVMVFAALAGIWQILSVVYTAEAQPGEPMIAGWQVLFTKTFLTLSDYWQGGLGVSAVADGAERSYLAALLSILSHSIDTIGRLSLGLALGGAVGLLLGLAVSWSRWTRRLFDWPLQFLRTLPLLAMVPLFQLWFGTYFFGEVLFVAYGIAVRSLPARSTPCATYRRSISIMPDRSGPRGGHSTGPSFCRRSSRPCARPSCSASAPAGALCSGPSILALNRASATSSSTLSSSPISIECSWSRCCSSSIRRSATGPSAGFPLAYSPGLRPRSAGDPMTDALLQFSARELVKGLRSGGFLNPEAGGHISKEGCLGMRGFFSFYL
jgi:ABC-type proline/glycine betaine transport system permease subunit